MCTRVFNNATNDFLTTARNMDWQTPLATSLFCFNKGLNKTGCEKITNKTLEWKSEYSSIVTMVGEDHDLAASEGVNSEGLVANALFNTDASYQSNFASFDKHLDVTRWVQYVLDTCKYVSEVVDKFADDSPLKIQLINKKMPTTDIDLLMHLAVSDIYGDSAIIEVCNGIFNVYHSDNFKVMTNKPEYETQILLNVSARYHWGHDNPMPSQMVPGGPQAVERLQRATYYLGKTEETYSAQESIAQTRAIIANTAVPIGFRLSSVNQNEIDETQWSSVSDHNNHTYYFYNSRTQDVCYCALNDVNFIDDVLTLDLIERKGQMYVQNMHAGLINHKFKVAEDPFKTLDVMVVEKIIA